ncbi:hypothetical protein V1505DRAFT_396142 [Lipomyces doorenjongii]
MLGFKPLERGVATHVYAAFYLDLKAHNDAYLIDSHVAYPPSDTVKSWATSKLEAKRLWELSGSWWDRSFHTRVPMYILEEGLNLLRYEMSMRETPEQGVRVILNIYPCAVSGYLSKRLARNCIK